MSTVDWRDELLDLEGALDGRKVSSKLPVDRVRDHDADVATILRFLTHARCRHDLGVESIRFIADERIEAEEDARPNQPPATVKRHQKEAS
jgi:hypothetical protein